MNRLGQTAVEFAHTAGLLLPAPPLPPAPAAPYGVAGVPVTNSPDGVAPHADASRVWESRWEIVRTAAARKLDALDQTFLVPARPSLTPPTIPDELRRLPDGTPEPDAKTYLALVDAVAAAAELYHNAPEPSCDFQEWLDYFAERRETCPDPENIIDPLVCDAYAVCMYIGEARRAYRAVEARLAGHGGAGGCAFRLALNAIRPVTDIAEDLLGVYRAPEYTLHRPPEDDSASATSYSYRPNIDPEGVSAALRRCTPFDPVDLLSPARQQMVRVAEATRREETARQAAVVLPNAPSRGRGLERAIANGKMMTLIQETRTCLKWPAREWSNYLGCGMTTVKKTPAWALIQTQRAANKPSAKDRRQKKKPRPPDDDDE